MAGIFNPSISHLFTIPAWIKKTGRFLGWSMLTVLVGLILLFILLRIPVIQRWLGQQAAAYLAKETGAAVQVEGFSFTYNGSIALNGLFIPDQNGDTLLYSGQLQAGIYLLPLYNGKISLKPLYWEDVVAHIVQKQDSSFNFSYLLDAFASTEPKVADTAASKPLQLTLSDVNLAKLRLHYHSDLNGDDYQLQLVLLELDPDEVDLDKLRFGINSLKVVGLDGSMRLHPSPTSTTTSPTAGPWIRLKNIDLKNIRYKLEQPGSQTLHTSLNSLTLDEATIDLAGEALQFGSLFSDSLDLALTFEAATAVKPEASETATFEWPAWRYSLTELGITNYAIRIQEKGSKPTPAVFNPADMVLQLNELQLKELSGAKGEIAWKKLLLDAREKCGLAVRTSFQLTTTATETSLQDLELETDNSTLSAEVKVNYSTFQSVLAKPLEQQVSIQLADGTLLSLKDALFFAPELAKDTTINRFIPWPLAVSGTMTGNINAMQLDEWELAWGEATTLAFSATLNAPMDSLKRDISLPHFEASSTAHDLNLLAKAEGYRYPAATAVKGSATFNRETAAIQFDLQADQGVVTGAAEVNGLQKAQPSYEMQLSARALDVGRLLNDSLLGEVGWVSTLRGSGFDPKTMEVTASIDFNQLQYQGYDYKALVLEAKAAAGLWEATINHQDTALGLAINASATLDSIWPAYKLYAQLDRADLKRLGFRDEPFELRFLLDASGHGTVDSLEAQLELRDGLVLQDGLAYPLQNFDLTGSMAPSTTQLALESDVISGAFKANAGLEALLAAVTNELRAQWKLDSSGITDSSRVDMVAEGNFSLHDTRLLREVLLPGLSALDSGQFSFKFDQNKHQLAVLAQVKNLDYQGSAVRNLFFDFEAEKGLKLKAGFDRLQQGQVDIHQTRLDMRVVDSLLYARFVVKDALQEPVFRLESQGGWQKNNRYISLLPDSTLFNRKLWQAHPNNRITFGEKLEFSDFTLSHNAQKLNVSSTPTEIRVTAEDFPLAALTSVLQADTLLAAGALSGYIALVDDQGQSGLLSVLRITDLAIFGQVLGDLKLDATMPAKNDYQISAAVKGPDIDLTVAGNYRMPASGTTLDMELDLKRFALKQLVVLSDSAIGEARGELLGKLEINGPLSSPVYVGEMQFKGANLKIAAFNSSFGLGEKVIRFNREGLVINQFELTDENKQIMRIDGRILTGGRPEAALDLKLKTQDFRVLNSTRADNDLYFGVLRMNLDLSISGSPSKPIIDARARLNKGSKLYIIIPESQLDVVEREGVVIFSRIDPKTDTLIDFQEQQTTPFLGMRLKSLLEVDKESELILIMDERSGDQLSVSGEANLKYDIYTNGRSSMTGVYEIRRGQYDLSLYELVKRKFELVPGGRITWNGDITDATLDLQALYRIKTSASDLMSAQLSGADESTRTRYRQDLPFEVYMNIEGNLLKPSISFRLDMPELQRSALDGNVYARLQQLNQQESDLNKQVFSLMVLNRFVPDGASNGGGNGASAMARSSVSQLLSSQLNSLSSQYVKGVDLNMDLNSYTDYTSGQAQDRTQLNVNVRKSFLDNRLAVEVGRQVDVQGSPQASNDIIGDVSVEYRLSTDGAYRLRGFRRNQQEGLAEGPLVVTGLSLVLSREFNGFDELLRKKKPVVPQAEIKPEEQP